MIISKINSHSNKNHTFISQTITDPKTKTHPPTNKPQEPKPMNQYRTFGFRSDTSPKFQSL